MVWGIGCSVVFSFLLFKGKSQNFEHLEEGTKFVRPVLIFVHWYLE